MRTDEPNEIVVSAAEPGVSSSPASSSGEVVVSAASPQKEENTNDMSSHFNKKEFREIGVGSADENHDIRSTQQGK